MKKQKQSEISNSPDLTQVEGEARIWTQSDLRAQGLLPLQPTNCNAIKRTIDLLIVFLNQKAWE